MAALNKAECECAKQNKRECIWPNYLYCNVATVTWSLFGTEYQIFINKTEQPLNLNSCVQYFTSLDGVTNSLMRFGFYFSFRTDTSYLLILHLKILAMLLHKSLCMYEVVLYYSNFIKVIFLLTRNIFKFFYLNFFLLKIKYLCVYY